MIMDKELEYLKKELLKQAEADFNLKLQLKKQGQYEPDLPPQTWRIFESNGG